MQNRSHSAHAQPVSQEMSSTNKLQYAKYRASQKAEQKRKAAIVKKQLKTGVVAENNNQITSSIRQNTSNGNKILLAALFACTILLTALIVRPDFSQSVSKMLLGNKSDSSQTSSSASSSSSKSQPTSSSTTSSSQPSSSASPTQNSTHNPNVAVSLSGQVEEAIFSHYGVKSYSAISGKHSEILSQILTITAVSDSRISITIGLTYSQTSKTALKEAADELISSIKGSVKDLNTITLKTQDSYFSVSVSQ